MAFIFIPSLKHIALVKIVITLTSQDGTDETLSSCNLFVRQSLTCKFQKVVECKVTKFFIPEALKKELVYALGAVCSQILKWEQSLNDIICKIGGVRQKASTLRWTSIGTIDKKKTAEVLVRDESLDVYLRYKLACVFCLEDDIVSLWSQLNESERGERIREYYLTRLETCLVSFWTHYVTGELNRRNFLWTKYCTSDTPYEYAFKHSIATSNEVATKFFLEKLTVEQRKKTVVPHANYVARTGFPTSHLEKYSYLHSYQGDIMFYLLSLMDEKQQIEMLKRHPCIMLKSFLDWPRQDLFISAAQHVWTFLSVKDYYRVLEQIRRKVRFDFEDYNYKNLFHDFWHQSLDSHRNHILNKCVDGVLSTVFRSRVKENISPNLKTASRAEKEKAVLAWVSV